MVCYCSVRGCKNNWTPFQDVKYYGLPWKNPDLLKIWLETIPLKNAKPGIYTKICSDHFTDDCYTTTFTGGKVRLKKDAVPTILQFSPNQDLKPKKGTFPSRKNPRVAITKRVEQINNEDLEMLYVEENEKNNIPTEENIYRLTNETYSSTLKQIADNENDRNLNICSRVLGTDKDEYIAAFGFTVAARLKKMSAIQRIYAENLINRILFQGQLKKLRETTTIDQTESSYEFVTVNYSSAT